MNQIVTYDSMRYAVQSVATVDEGKAIKDRAEALQLYAKQAHDRELEVWTSEIKLRAVRRLGELSAGIPTSKGGNNPAATLPADGKSKEETLSDAGISTSAAHRYEQVAAMDAEHVEQYIADKKANGEPVSVSDLLAPRPHVSNNSGNNEWYTPPQYIACARAAMGAIDVDPASSAVANQTVGATTFYTAEDNGLTQPWRGAVWMNPPYAQPLIADFCDAVATKYQAGEIEQACVLVNNATETGWFQRLLSAASAVCFIKGRIRYLDAQGNVALSPLQGQAVIYFGADGARVARFAKAFESVGVTLYV